LPTNYITSTQLKNTLEIGTATYADDDITTAISSASRVIDAYKDTRFYPTAETRKYTANQSERSLQIDDLVTLTSFTVDLQGNGSYGTTWVQDTDFYLEPINAALDGRPYNQVTLRPQQGDIWPPFNYGVQIGGTFGWTTAPYQVTQATTILAGRYLKRARETPYGILTIGTDAIAAARLGKIDPDVSFLLDNLDADEPLLIL
jgi:hypothetical protein